jgi:hypothetical protein
VTVSGADRVTLAAELDEVRSSVRAEKLADVAAEFDRIHSIQRAVEVGSVDAVIRAAEMRPRIIEAIETARPCGARNSLAQLVAPVLLRLPHERGHRIADRA